MSPRIKEKKAIFANKLLSIHLNGDIDHAHGPLMALCANVTNRRRAKDEVKEEFAVRPNKTLVMARDGKERRGPLRPRS